MPNERPALRTGRASLLRELSSSYVASLAREVHLLSFAVRVRLAALQKVENLDVFSFLSDLMSSLDANLRKRSTEIL